MDASLARTIIRDAGGLAAAADDPRFYDTKRLLRMAYPGAMIELLPSGVTIVSGGERMRVDG